MIKIEKIAAEKATIVRGGVRQPLVLHSYVTADELATVEAASGTVVYSVDEAEIKELTFQEAPPPAKPIIKQPAPRVVQPAAKAAEPTPQSATVETPAA